MKKTVLSIGSVTYAIKAQKVLSDNNVPSKVVKTKTTKTKANIALNKFFKFIK